MNYRKLVKAPFLVSEIGIGAGNLHMAKQDEIYAIIDTAVQNGINFFDLCAGGESVFKPFGKAINQNRDKVHFQLHFGAVYNEKGEYGWSRDLKRIKQTFTSELDAINTDYVDFGFLHCVDDEGDFKDIIDNGILDYVKDLKKQGIVKHIGFSSHTPEIADKLMDTKVMDMMMFSINPAYDMELGDEYGIGTTNERAKLFRRAVSEGIGISVMKPFHGGQLLDEKTSPFKKAMTHYQCLKYCLDRPGVVTVVPGVSSLKDLQVILGYERATDDEKDYSMIASFTPQAAVGNCVYCNHCKPCPAGIDIGLVNKYYDLAKSGDKIAENHYYKLQTKASACVKCGHCDKRCPFGVKAMAKMQTINDYFSKN